MQHSTMMHKKALPAAVPYLIFLAACLYYGLSSSYSMFDFPLDDAWIHRVYSSSFASGNGLQYNDGIQETGATSPLWVILTSPAHWLENWGTKTVVTAVKGIGILLGCIALFCLQGILVLLTGSRWAGIIAASLFAADPRLVLSALSGMETNLLIALWGAAVYAFAHQRWQTASLVLGLMAVTRPESLVVIPLFLIGIQCIARSLPIFQRLILIVLCGLPMLLWSIFCKVVSDHWLPGTFYIKAEPFSMNVEKLHLLCDALTAHGYLTSLSFICIGLGSALLWALRQQTITSKTLVFLNVAAAIIYALAVVASRVFSLDGYYFIRWIDPAVLLLSATCCSGVAFMLSGSLSLPGSPRVRLFMRTALGLIAVSLAAPGFIKDFSHTCERLASDSRVVHILNVQSGKWLYENTPTSAVVGVIEAGAIRYFGKRHTIDLIGLNTSDIAHNKIGVADLFNRIDWLVVYPACSNKLTPIIQAGFDPVQTYRVAPEEYTICSSSCQSAKGIYKKKSGIVFESKK